MSSETIYKAQKQEIATRPLQKTGIRLVVGGSVLLALTLSGVSIFPIIAPLLFVSGIGALMMWPAMQSTADNKSNWSFFAAPGAAMVALGAMIFVLNLISHQEAFAYLWTVIPISFTGGMMYSRRFEETHPIHRNGERFIRIFSIIGITMGIVFELFVFNTFGPWWPLFLIGYGIYLLVLKTNLKKKPQ